MPSIADLPYRNFTSSSETSPPHSKFCLHHATLLCSFAELTSSSASIPSLTGLPEDILHRVLEHLLSTKQPSVLEPHPDHYLPRRRLYPAILRANKLLYDIGGAILESNHFILVSTKYPKLCQAFENNHGHAWKDRNLLALYQKYHMRLHIVPRHNVQPLRIDEFFMICAQDVSTLVMTLHMLCLANQPRLNLKFVLKKPTAGESLTKRLQQELLSPFKVLRGRHQRCTISGAVDSDLQQEVENCLTQTIYWTRIEDREFYKLCIQKKALAMHAVDGGKWLTALSHHREIASLCEVTTAITKEVLRDCDESLSEVIYQVHTWLCISHNLVMMKVASLAKNKDITQKLYRGIANSNKLATLSNLNNLRQDSTATTVWRISLLLRSVAAFAIGDDEGASQNILHAFQGSQSSHVVQRSYELIKDFRSQSRRLRNREKTLAQLLQLIPRVPWEMSHLPEPISANPTILIEELRRLKTYQYSGAVQEHLSEKDTEDYEDIVIEENDVYERHQRDVAGCRLQRVLPPEIVIGTRSALRTSSIPNNDFIVWQPQRPLGTTTMENLTNIDIWVPGAM